MWLIIVGAVGLVIALSLILQKQQEAIAQPKESDVIAGEKITQDYGTGYKSRNQLDMYTKATREYERGQLAGLEMDDDPIAQSIINELKTRAIDGASNSKYR